MNGIVFKRCGCSTVVRDGDGEPVRGPDGRIRRRGLNRACTRLIDADGSWSTAHGSWYFQLQDPAVPHRHFRRGGFAGRQDAEQALAQVRELLACAREAVDPVAARVAISQAVHAAITRGAALPDVDRVRGRLRRGLTPTVSLSVGQWLTMWLTERTDLRPATRLNYSGLIEQHLLPALGDIPLEELRPEQVRAVLAGVGAQAREIRAANQGRHAAVDTARAAWRAHDSAAARAARQQLAALPPFRRPAGASTVQRVRAVLRSALSEAVRRELVTVNVAKLVRLPAPRRARALEWTPARVAAWRETGKRPSPVMVWTPAQTRRFLNRAASHRLSALFVLLAFTGCRRGEACGLHWADVDFQRREAAISTQLCRIGAQTIEGPPKTDAGVRTVALAKVLHTALVARRHAQGVERRAAGAAWTDTGRVFANPDGSELNPAYVSDAFDRLVRDEGLPPIRLHDLRHGAATHALDAGVPVKVVSDMLGHSSTTVTLDLYATVTDRSRHAAADAIAHRLEG